MRIPKTLAATIEKDIGGSAEMSELIAAFSGCTRLSSGSLDRPFRARVWKTLHRHTPPRR